MKRSVRITPAVGAVALVALVFVHHALAVTNCQWNGYDLSTLASDQTYTAGSVLYNGFICGVVSAAGPCKTGNGALCAFDTPPPVYKSLLAVWDNSGVWSQIDDEKPALGVQISFANGDACGGAKTSVTFRFPCGTQSPKPLVVTSPSACNYLVTYQNMATCTGGTIGGGGGGSKGISGGSVFLIIFFVGGFVYVALGCLYKRQKMGAAGMESCPNIDFWRTLPGLVADGFRFTFAKLRGLCGGGAGGGAEAYETVK